MYSSTHTCTCIHVHTVRRRSFLFSLPLSFSPHFSHTPVTKSQPSWTISATIAVLSYTTCVLLPVPSVAGRANREPAAVKGCCRGWGGCFCQNRRSKKYYWENGCIQRSKIHKHWTTTNTNNTNNGISPSPNRDSVLSWVWINATRDKNSSTKTCTHLVVRRPGVLFVFFRFHIAHDGTTVDDTNVFRAQAIHKEAAQMPQHLVQFLHVVLQWVKPHQQRFLLFFVVAGPARRRQIGVPLWKDKKNQKMTKNGENTSIKRRNSEALPLLAYRWVSLIWRWLRWLLFFLFFLFLLFWCWVGCNHWGFKCNTTS